MKNPLLPFILIVLLATNTLGAGHPIFNGHNLDGWYSYLKGRGKNCDPNNVFTVEKGVIHISGEEFGCLTTNLEYENYRLEVEYRWGDKTSAPRVNNARDSGILLHSVGEDGAFGGIWMHSIECQLIEGGTGDLLAVGDGSNRFALTCPVQNAKQGGSFIFQPEGHPVTIHGGRINWQYRDPAWQDVKGYRGAHDRERPLGKWNHLKCIANGGEILVYLNGKLVNHAIEVTPRKGKIQIQSEGAELFVKKVNLYPLR